jgi:hypothetical protein
MDDSSRTKSGFPLLVGGAAFAFGVLMILASLAGRWGLIREAPHFVFPTGTALVLSGYIACFSLRGLNKRIEDLERRVLDLANCQTRQNDGV